MQKSLSNAQDHIWFERSEIKDRLTVAKRFVLLYHASLQNQTLKIL